MSDERLDEVRIVPLESGFIVTRAFRDEYDERDEHRTAEPTLTGAIGIAARALGYHGTIEFSQGPYLRQAVTVPVVDDPAAYAPPGVPFDAEEPPLRAGTAKPGDKL